MECLRHPDREIAAQSGGSRDVKLDRPVPLETRSLMAPVVATFPLQATFTAAPTPTNAGSGHRRGLSRTRLPRSTRMAPITSVSELTPISSFGGDIVTIAAGPGGVFGNVIYAISRGAGDNADAGAVNRPGVIYRVNPATGKTQRVLRSQHGDEPDRPEQSDRRRTRWGRRRAW